MQFNITRSSGWGIEDEIEINTLEELINWIKQTGESVIIHIDDIEDEKTLEIYDDYRE